MTKHIDSALSEAISSTLDGEHNDIDLQRVLSALDDENAREQVSKEMSRYQLIGSVMRGEEASIVSVDISASVMAAIESEDAHSLGGLGKKSSASDKSRFSPLWYGAGKTAVAASVMLAVVMGAQTFMTTDQGQLNPNAVVALDAANDAASTSVSAQAVGDAVPNGFELPPLTARTVSTNPFNSRAVLPRSPVNQNATPIIIDGDEYQEELNRLLFKHAEKASAAGSMGALPYTRLPEASSQADHQE